jgi:hypothetical protein
VVSPIVRLLRIASFAICVIVIASFVFFVVDQTRAASGHQQERITAAAANPASATPASPSTSSGERHSPVRNTIEDFADELTSPFSGVVSASSGEWAVRGVKLMLALLLYGFGLGYLARVLRVRV